jgi:hypothetical protein
VAALTGAQTVLAAQCARALDDADEADAAAAAADGAQPPPRARRSAAALFATNAAACLALQSVLQLRAARARTPPAALFRALATALAALAVVTVAVGAHLRSRTGTWRLISDPSDVAGPPGRLAGGGSAYAPLEMAEMGAQSPPPQSPPPQSPPPQSPPPFPSHLFTPPPQPQPRLPTDQAYDDEAWHEKGSARPPPLHDAPAEVEALPLLPRSSVDGNEAWHEIAEKGTTSLLLILPPSPPLPPPLPLANPPAELGAPQLLLRHDAELLCEAPAHVFESPAVSVEAHLPPQETSALSDTSSHRHRRHHHGHHSGMPDCEDDDDGLLDSRPIERSAESFDSYSSESDGSETAESDLRLLDN